MALYGPKYMISRFDNVVTFRDISIREQNQLLSILHS